MENQHDQPSHNVESSSVDSNNQWRLDTPEMQELILQAAEEEANEEQEYVRRERLSRKLGELAGQNALATDDSRLGQFQLPEQELATSDEDRAGDEQRAA